MRTPVSPPTDDTATPEPEAAGKEDMKEQVQLTPKEAAVIAKVSVSLIYAWCKKRTLPHSRRGQEDGRGKIIIEEADLRALMERQRVAGRTDTPSAPLKHIVTR